MVVVNVNFGPKFTSLKLTWDGYPFVRYKLLSSPGSTRERCCPRSESAGRVPQVASARTAPWYGALVAVVGYAGDRMLLYVDPHFEQIPEERGSHRLKFNPVFPLGLPRIFSPA